MRQFEDAVWVEKPWRKRSNLKTPMEKRMVARAMMDGGMSTRQAGNLVGIAPSTAYSIKMDPDLSPEYVSKLKNSLPGKYYKLAHSALDAITPEKLNFLNGYQQILTSKISADAARMCEGLPTQIIQTRTLAVRLHGDINELQKRKQNLLSKLGGTLVDVQDSTVGGNKRVKKL